MSERVGTSARPSATPGFTLVEVVIVVLVLSIIAAVASPKLVGVVQNGEVSALSANLTAIRNALEHYAIDHPGNYPGALTALARFTSTSGAMSSSKSSFYKDGKYLDSIPACPVGSRKGATGWGACPNPPAGESGSSTIGWLYNAASGRVWVNDDKTLDM